jgi:hypothetical protein
MKFGMNIMPVEAIQHYNFTIMATVSRRECHASSTQCMVLKFDPIFEK